MRWQWVGGADVRMTDSSQRLGAFNKKPTGDDGQGRLGSLLE